MSVKVEALITPEVLIWARKTDHLSLESVAKKLRLSAEQLEQWEQGVTRPSVSQLRKLANIYRRPLAVFYLPEPPTTFKVPHDYRKLPEKLSTLEVPELYFEIRRACERRIVALEIYEELEELVPPLELRIGLNDDPEVVGMKIREILGLSLSKQREWQSDYEARNWWRSALEAQGILVLQVRGIPVSVMRGFSINEKILPVIAVNSKDRIRGRIFTMLHEFVHILLDRGGLCILDETHLKKSEETKIEVYCNRVAAATLVPKAFLELENEVSGTNQNTIWSDDTLRNIAKRYSVSRETILRRLLTLGYTTEEYYQKKRNKFLEEYKTLEKKKSGGIAKPTSTAVNNNGPSFTRLILTGYYQEKVSIGEVAEYLGVRIKHLTGIEKLVFG